MTAETFSRPVKVEAIPRDGQETTIEADPAERAALAAFNGLPSVGKFIATFTLKHSAGGSVRVRGEILAEVTQTCVVTLEPFEAAIAERVDVRFAPRREEPTPGQSREREVAHKVDEENDPDAIVDGVIDLGVVASEFLSLSLDTYPRKPGVAFEPPATGDDVASDSPFSALSSKKDR
jgi:Large ribosomal RNA subunit accumulation protein YceD